MKIKMTKIAKGSTNGITLNTYHTGQEYDIPESLAVAFIHHMKVAEFVVAPVEIEIPEQIEIEVPEQIEIEAPKKTIKRKPGRPKKVTK